MVAIACSGIRDQYTHPPNGSFNGIPSSKTLDRLVALAPTPRSDTPCDVGFANKLLDLR